MDEKVSEILAYLRPIPKKHKTMQGVHLGEELIERLTVFRSHTGVPVSKLIRKLLEDFLNKYEEGREEE